MNYENYKECHRYFAWLPVEVNNNDWAWFIFVERRLFSPFAYIPRWWIYRLIDKK